MHETRRIEPNQETWTWSNHEGSSFGRQARWTQHQDLEKKVIGVVGDIKTE